MRWLVVGGLATLVALIVLWRLTRDLTAPSAPSEPIATESGSASPQAPSLPSSRDPASPARPRSPPIEPPVVRIPQPRPLDRPSEVTTEIPDAPPFDVGKVMRATLRRQVASIDPYVSECVARANNRGTKITGRAALTVVITLDTEGKVRVTEVGIEPSGTNIEDVLLLNCLRDAGKKMQLENLPDGVTSIRATREVSLDGGSITKHTLSAMELLPAGAAPP